MATQEQFPALTFKGETIECRVCDLRGRCCHPRAQDGIGQNVGTL
jgi:hypothetical protein